MVCIDEFQQIAEFNNSLHFQRELRSAWQLHRNVTFCLYGSKQHLMARLFSKQSMPLYKSGDIMFLQKIATSDWIDFICHRFEVTGKKILPELAWLLCNITDKYATDADFDLAYTDLLNQNSILYYKYIDSLTTSQLNFLHAIAEGVTS